jgi:hypothetical protein
MDKQNLLKAPLDLFHIVEASNDVGDGWTREDTVEREIEDKCGKFQIHNSTTGRSTWPTRHPWGINTSNLALLR